MRLSECTNGRNNNFNLLRIIAAFSVLVAHSYALTSLHEPSIIHLGIDLGQAAVDLFFVTSGFLVTSSLLRIQNTAEFIYARALRIYPALWIVLLLSVVLLGPVFTVLPLSLFAAAPQTYIYFCRCATLFFGVSFTLPGVFANNPFPRSINGSLWTLQLKLCFNPLISMKIKKIFVFLALFGLLVTRGRVNAEPAFDGKDQGAIGRALELLSPDDIDHLHEIVTAAKEVAERPNEADWPKAKELKLTCLLKVFTYLNAVDLSALKLKAFLNVPPPVATGLPPGVDPAVIEDPSQRMIYEDAIKQNKVICKAVNRAVRVRDMQRQTLDYLQRYVKRAFTASETEEVRQIVQSETKSHKVADLIMSSGDVQ